MDYSNKTCKELIAICKDKNIKGYSGKKKDEIILLLNNTPNSSNQIILHLDNCNTNYPTFVEVTTNWKKFTKEEMPKFLKDNLDRLAPNKTKSVV